MADVVEKPTEEVVAVETTKDADAEDVAAPVAAAAGAEETKVEDVVSSEESGLTKLERSIVRQVEYYFGDANLNRDKFLLEQISKNEDGWVPLTVLLTFKRLASLSSDTEVIINALVKSDEGLLEISEDKEKVRRHPERPIPEHNEERRKEIMSRTAYAKGFPLEIDMSELLDFFAPYDKVVNINMRKYLDKPTKTYKFKGSVFVTFEKKEQTQEFVDKEKVLFNERELLRKMQENYLEEKKEEQKSKSKKAKKPVEEDKIKLPKGTVLFFEGATDVVTRETLREAIEKVEGDEWTLAFIDFSKGDKDGHIRFHEENVAVKFLEKLTDKKLKLSDDVELALRTISEDDEKIFLEKAVEHMKSRRSQQNKSKGHHGHHHGNRKRRGGNDRNEERKKKRNDD